MNRNFCTKCDQGGGGSSTEDFLQSVHLSSFLFCSIKICLQLYTPLLTYPLGVNDFVDLLQETCTFTHT